MRTTVQLEGEALDLSRRRAKETGRSLAEVISEAILKTYSPEPLESKEKAPSLPVDGQGGLLAGVDIDNNARLENILSGV